MHPIGTDLYALFTFTALRLLDLDAATHSHVICLRERMKSRLVMSFLELVHQLRGELATARRAALAGAPAGDL